MNHGLYTFHSILEKTIDDCFQRVLTAVDIPQNVTTDLVFFMNLW